MQWEAKQQSEFYYNAQVRNSLADYSHGNPRIEAAIRHLLRWVPLNAKRVLDIGCGLGWSSWELKRHRAGATVLGVDLSSRLLDCARQLFMADGLTFAAHDISDWSPLLEPAFDVIAILDMYEHIPPPLRPAIHQVFARALQPGGAIVMSFPSARHQQFLRTHRPAGLQPVDEDITEEIIATMAGDLGGRVVMFTPIKVWDEGDYIHAVIQRPAAPARAQSLPITLESPAARQQRVRQRLDIRVTRDGYLLPNRSGPTVCVIQPNRSNYSETAIRNQIEMLPANVTMLTHGWLPTRQEDGSRLQPLPVAALCKALRALPRLFGTLPHRLASRYVALFLRRQQVAVVLAEYGVTGVHVQDACRFAGVPLVVHFHGFDAYDHSTLEKYGKRYQRLWENAAAVIAVSHHMEQQLISLGAPRAKVVYCPCGADPALFAGGAPATAPPLFIAVGRFTAKKAPDLTLRAFAKVHALIPEARLLMVGDGELLEQSRQLTHDLQIDHAVAFKPPQPHYEIATLLRTARAFVQHSVTAVLGDSEGTPATVLEAGLSGLPVVSTYHAGIPDVVIHNQTGFLVPERDVESMAAYMVKLAQDPQLAARMGQCARDHITATLSTGVAISRLWSILQTAMLPKPAAIHS